MEEYLIQDFHYETRFKIDYEKELNEAQYKAVTALEGPILVIAGAGSGKTRTLVFRVARLIEMGVSPKSILLLTFTKKAAYEMLSRASCIIDKRCENVCGGTFHSFANYILRLYSNFIGYPSKFTVMDRPDAEDTINFIRTLLGLSEKERRFPKKDTLADIYSKSINRNKSIEKIIENEYPHFIQDTKDILDIFKLYQEYKKNHYLMDYDDLLIYMKLLLESNEDIRREISQRYRYIMIDEYQDTNKLQADIVTLLAYSHNNIMAVGDDSQSIYSFRGANFKNIMDFPKIFPNTKIIKLEENYRSTQPILNLTNRIISKAKEKYEKRLYTRRKDGAIPILALAQTEKQQSKFVIRKVLELREKGVPLNEIAVLFRAAYHSYDLELELTKANITYVKYGGFKFFETAHIKDILSYLRVAYNPKDFISWNRMLLLQEGIGSRGSLDIIEWVSQTENPFDFSLFPKKKKYINQLTQLANLLTSIQPDSIPVSEKIGIVLENYFPILAKKYDDYPKRKKDIEQLQIIASNYQTLTQFLTDMSLEPPNKSSKDLLSANEDNEKTLILSTIHSAKGLEWHSVFIIHALEGKFPAFYTLHSQEELEEERRLMYVATTRAKENLFICYPINLYDHYTGMLLSRPSQFIRDIDNSMLRKIVITEPLGYLR